jgi:branched-chain amino acid transport system substrate-binding protein
MRKTICFLSLLFLPGLIGCTKKVDEIRIGVAGPMTGDQSKLGQDLQHGVEIAVDEWNQKGGVLRKKIAVDVGDDQHDPKQAVSVANKFVTSGVVGVVGHFNSSASIPASGVYHASGIPMITPASTNPQLTAQGYADVFRICGKDDQQGKVAAEFVVNKLKARKVAILHDKTTYGQGLADLFKQSVEALGKGSVEVVYYAGITQGDKDFRGVLTSIVGTRPDLLYFGGIYPEGGLIAKQGKDLGLSAPMMSGDGVIDPKFVEIAGKAAEGTYLTFGPDPKKFQQGRRFLEKYQARFGPEWAPYAIYAYDAANLLLNAIQRAGTTDGEKVTEALHKIQYDGALGRIEFDADGDVKKSPYVVWITRNGNFEEYWTPDE